MARGILSLLLSLAAALETAVAATPEIPLADGDLLAAVRPFPQAALSPRDPSLRNQQLLDGYGASIRAWGDVVAAHFRPVPAHPAWGYYGLGGHTEDEVRPITFVRDRIGTGDLSDPRPRDCRGLWRADCCMAGVINRSASNPIPLTG